MFQRILTSYLLFTYPTDPIIKIIFKLENRDFLDWIFYIYLYSVTTLFLEKNYPLFSLNAFVFGKLSG